MTIIELLMRFPAVVAVWSGISNLAFGIQFNPFRFVESNAHLLGLAPSAALFIAICWTALAIVWILIDLKNLVAAKTP